MPPPVRALAAVAIASASLLASCGEAQKQAAPPPPKVTVAKPIKRTIVDQDEYVGRFVPVDVVEIRARVSGYLDKLHFTDGQIVKQGDLLFTIDNRPYQNTLDQARANLETAKSNLAFTQSDLARGQQLVRERTISEQIYEQRAQAFRNAQASVAANEAMVRQAQLDLEYTELRAPIAGRIGDRRVTQGNLVTGGAGGNTSLLATIVSTDPIRFEFTFDEGALLRYQRLATGGGEVAGLGGTQVRLKLLDETDFFHPGRVDFVDNVIDRASGTIRGRAQLSNTDGLFTPGMFARVQVPASAPYQALMLPDAAIATDQARKFVYVIDQDNIARLRYVTLGQVVDDLRVIKDGLADGDRIVINGLMRVRQGQKVTPEEQPASPQASVPAAAPTNKTD
ncbi:MAG: efflux transporter periplasmic adaptor subunit [Alphaproteobacteria bacterium 13_2_20CM_2_64_7]|nr:MAG: efflux transporter periplasmic adaptor subunit [Alphaproteobacteria bacterium 13_2_20CM_2_64_7]